MIDYRSNLSLPSYLMIGTVLNARVLPPCGNVVNDTQRYSFGKWYWEPRRQSACINPRQLMHNQSFDIFARFRTTNESEAGGSAPALVTLVSFASNVFSHIVMDILPKVSVICDSLLSLARVAILVSIKLQQDLVRLVCPDASSHRFIFLPAHKAVRAPVVYVPFVPGSIGLYPPNVIRPIGLSKPCGDAFMSGHLQAQRLECNPPSDLVYLWRPRGVRSVTDHTSLLHTMRAAWRCGRVVLVNSSSWKDDRRALSAARVVVAPHGGAVANIVFAAPGAHVIELITRSGLRQRPCYFGLANALGFTYEYVEPQKFDFFAPMTVGQHSLAQISSTLQAICEGRPLARPVAAKATQYLPNLRKKRAGSKVTVSGLTARQH